MTEALSAGETRPLGRLRYPEHGGRQETPDARSEPGRRPFWDLAGEAVPSTAAVPRLASIPYS
jgi:hypothetical protein